MRSRLRRQFVGLLGEVQADSDWDALDAHAEDLLRKMLSVAPSERPTMEQATEGCCTGVAP